jgi:PilZ domain-containing protein
MERRKHARQNLSAPVRFDWELSDGGHHQGTGVTRDVSAGGLFVVTEDPPAVGTSVYLKVDLKTSRLNPTATIQAKGQVSRIEMIHLTGQLIGFALSTRRMTLRKPD